jgi:hypothetical protein
MSSFGRDRDTTLAGHPTPKPLALVSDAILDCSKRDGIVLDAFAGSGTTLLAAEKTGRRGYGIELDAHFVDLAIKRLAEVYGLAAIHSQSGLRFDQVKAQRTERTKNDETQTIHKRTRTINAKLKKTGERKANDPKLITQRKRTRRE